MSRPKTTHGSKGKACPGAADQKRKQPRQRRPACITEPIRVLPAKVIPLRDAKHEEAVRSALRQLYDDFLTDCASRRRAGSHQP
jgi:hypothetical protein